MKVKMTRDVHMMGTPFTLKKDEIYYPEKINSRFCYIRINTGCICKISTKDFIRL